MDKVLTQVSYKKLRSDDLFDTKISVIGGTSGAGKTTLMWRAIALKISENIPVVVYSSFGKMEAPVWAWHNPLIRIIDLRTSNLIPDFSLLEKGKVSFVFIDEVRSPFEIRAGFHYYYVLHASNEKQARTRVASMLFPNSHGDYVDEVTITSRGQYRRPTLSYPYQRDI